MRLPSSRTVSLFSLFFPRTCPMCGRYAGEKGGPVCEQCLRTLPRTEQAQLRQNSTEMALESALRLDRAAAFLFFEKEHPIQRLMHAMKYGEQPQIGYQLGRQAAMEFQYAGFFDGIDLIIPIPLHPKRERERGYNQSEFIARGISEVTGIEVDTSHVTRVKDTPKQALQTEEGRRLNMANAFAANHPEQVYGKHILVVDDVITTGETMLSCLKAMRRFRGATYSVLALCKAK